MDASDGRRAVAEGLRGLAGSCDEDEAVSVFDVMCECGMDPEEFMAQGSPGWVTALAVETLADLIDRPTCRNLLSNGLAGGKYERFMCSRCRYSEVRKDGRAFNYCPICGASVTGLPC